MDGRTFCTERIPTMVKITPEEVIEQRRQAKNMADLTHHDLKVIGRSCRRSPCRAAIPGNRR